MTKLLDKAFEEASKLPELEQNALARWLITEQFSKLLAHCSASVEMRRS